MIWKIKNKTCVNSGTWKNIWGMPNYFFIYKLFFLIKIKSFNFYFILSARKSTYDSRINKILLSLNNHKNLLLNIKISKKQT